MQTAAHFTILNSVDSTNNYAMDRVHAGMTNHGMAWFTHAQTAGKGQRGKSWLMEKGKGIAMSVVLVPERLQITDPFHLSAAFAVIVCRFFQVLAGDDMKIKWPNDIFWRDRKAGGILIENIYQGKNWKWAVAGVGININQTAFENSAGRPVSLKLITGNAYEPVDLARQLHEALLSGLAASKNMDEVLSAYNALLFCANEQVVLKKDGQAFTTMIREVSSDGKLLTVDTEERSFAFGEVEWVF